MLKVKLLRITHLSIAFYLILLSALSEVKDQAFIGCYVFTWTLEYFKFTYFYGYSGLRYILDLAKLIKNTDQNA